MKTILVVFVSLVLTGCASFDEKSQHMSTAELRLRRQQLVERLADNSVQFQFHAFGGGTKDKEELWKEKEAIERELLRRCNGGDREACLPAPVR